MGRDTTQKQLEEYDDVFIDIFDNLLFEGREVLKGRRLTPLPGEGFVRDHDGKSRQRNRDILKADGEHGVYRLICGLENQTGVENTMPERVMGYEYASYERQIRGIAEKNRMEGRPAYAKRIHGEQKLAPVVTAVLYYGAREWDGPKRLHDMLDFSGDGEQVRPYVADYPMNLIDLGRLSPQVRGRLTSDFRLVADYLACRGEPEERRRLKENRNHVIRHPEEFLDVMREITSDVRYEKIKARIKENRIQEEEGKEGLTMYDLFADAEHEGMEKGIEKGVRAVVELCREMGLTVEEARQKVEKKFEMSIQASSDAVGRYWGSV